MANVNELFNELDNKKTYYKEDTNSKYQGDWQPSLEGEYLGHITDVQTRLVEFKNYKARVYNLKFTVAEENKSMEYQKGYWKEGKFIDLGKITGECYAGRVFRSIGIFRFLEPGEGDEFESNSAGNKNYLSLCSAVAKEPTMVTQTIDGKEIELKELPSLNEADLMGVPVKAAVRKGKEYQDKKGKTRNYLDVKWVMKWEEGSKIDVKDTKNDEIPF